MNWRVIVLAVGVVSAVAARGEDWPQFLGPARNGVYAGKDAEGTEVLVYFNDTANVISCTEMEPDLGPDEE